MKTLFFVISVFLSSNFVFSQAIYKVDNDGGGSVTNIVAGYNVGANIDRLYMRTDNGGVYKTNYVNGEWQNWTSIYSYSTDISGMPVQGIVVKPSDPNTVLICCGNSNEFGDNKQCYGIWKTTNGGVTWGRKFYTYNSKEVMFEGVWPYAARSGECIIYDPANENVMFAGGYTQIGDTYNRLYKSTNGGETWTGFTSGTIKGNVTCVYVSAYEPNIIWVGTRVDPSEYNSANFYCLYRVNKSTGAVSTVSAFKAGDIGYEVHRVVFYPINGSYERNGFVSYNTFSADAIKATTDGGGSWYNVYPDYNSGAIYNIGFYKNTDMDDKDIDNDAPGAYIFMTSRINGPTFYSSDFGNSFNTINFQESGTVPKHVHQHNDLYWGRNTIVQHPARKTEFFMSGGQGMEMSFECSFNSYTWYWYYHNTGISQINGFQYKADQRSGAMSYLKQGAIADWFSCRTQQNLGYTNEVIALDYGINASNFEWTYNATSITRIMSRSGGTSNVSYYGGAENNNQYGVLYKSTNYGVNFTNISCSFLGTNSFVADGLACYDHAYPNVNPKLLLLIGGNNSGEEFPKFRNSVRGVGMTIGESIDNDENKALTRAVWFGYEDQYGNLQWVNKSNGLSSESYLPPQFNYNHNLAYDNNTSLYKYYLYLKGHFYVSPYDPGSANFYWNMSNPSVDNGLQEGSVIVDRAGASNRCFLGTVEYMGTGYNQKGGLIRGVPNAGATAMTWTKINGWKSINAFDVYDNQFVIFGKQDGDSKDYLYTATYNPTNNTLGNIEQFDYEIPSIVDLEWMPGFKVGVSTGGEGLLWFCPTGGNNRPVLAGTDGQELTLKLPTTYALKQNFPNPFNPATTIAFELPKSSFVSLKVYDMSGKEVANLLNENVSSGFHEINFNGSNLSSGIYFYTINANGFVQTKKMVLSK